MNWKLAGSVVLAIVVAFGVGWIVGASGRSTIEQARAQSEMRAEFAEVRSRILGARVSLFLVNFGDAGRQLEDARGRAEKLQSRLRELGQAERAGKLEIAIAHLRDAQRLTSSVDQSAQASADEALKALAAVNE